LLLLVCTIPACSRGPQFCHIRGTVTYQGAIIDEADIIFSDVEQRAPTAASRIEHGKYQVKVLPGKKTVRITASKKTGRMLTGAMGVDVPERIELIPAKYNIATTLTCTAELTMPATLDFNLN